MKITYQIEEMIHTICGYSPHQLWWWEETRSL